MGLLAWSVLQVMAASVVNLGGTYGWYLTVAIPPLAVTAAITVGEQPRSTAAHRRWLGAVATLSLTLAGGLWSTIGDGVDRVDSGDLLEQDRYAAGRWLDRHAPAGAVVDTCFGWVAYEAPGVTIDDRCGLTSEVSPGPAQFLAEAPGGRPAPVSARDHRGGDVRPGGRARRRTAADRGVPCNAPPP